MNFDLRLAPAVLAILLLVSSFGPWGAMGASIASQTAELTDILRDKGLLVDGKIVARLVRNDGTRRLVPTPRVYAASNGISTRIMRFAGSAGSKAPSKTPSPRARSRNKLA